MIATVTVFLDDMNVSPTDMQEMRVISTCTVRNTTMDSVPIPNSGISLHAIATVTILNELIK